MDPNDFDGFIFDVDGTLYSQKKLRRAVFLRLLAHYAFRPFRWRELRALTLFRRLREKREFKKKNVYEVCGEVARNLNMAESAVCRTVRRWMFENPLDLLLKYRYDAVFEFIKRARSAGKKIVIYSDYPAAEKLAAMRIPYDLLFVSGENGIAEQKPSEDAMYKILAASALAKDKIVYIGDRDDRDRASAELAHIAYCDIGDFLKSLTPGR